MSNSDYKLKKLYIEEIDYELLIIELPEEEVEDSLAYFAKEKGRITKEYYDDYLLATFVANINQMIQKLSKGLTDTKEPVNMEELRQFIITKIIEYNPSLSYDNITINKHGVLKLKANCDDGVILSENKYWNFKKEEKPDEQSIVIKEQNTLKPIEDIEYSVQKIWWKRLGIYIEVKKFDSGDLTSILQNRIFQSRTSFATFVVTLCVIDYEGLFQLLDTMGVPTRVAPPLLMHEICELCLVANPFLTFDNSQSLLKDKESKTDTPNKTKQAGSTSATMNKYVESNKQKKTFKDIPNEDLLNLGMNMKVSLIGQDEAVDNLVEAIQRASVGLKNPEKPIGSFMFAGKTGCGKTLASKVLADELIRDRDSLITIDCSEYSADHEYSKLIGAPPGYVNSDQGGILTNAVMKNPFSVVVFDEIEKASDKIYQLLLQVLEEGRLTDNKGNIVQFKDTVIILTSNIGVDEVASIKKTIGFGNVAEVTEEKKATAIGDAIKKKFKPEFLNRLDEIIYFKDLTPEDYKKIIDIELYKLNDNLQANDTKYKTLKLEFAKSIKSVIYDEGVDAEYGARPIKRAIERVIATPLAVKLLSGKVKAESIVKIGAKKGKAIFTVAAPKKKETLQKVEANGDS